MDNSINDKSFSFKMAKINKIFTILLNKNLEEYDLTRSEIPYLITLYDNENVSQEFLSKTYSLNEATVARALNRLEKKEFIKRIPNPDDKRKKMVSLTEKGKKIANMIVKHKESYKEKIFADFTKEEYDELIRLLNKMFITISDMIY